VASASSSFAINSNASSSDKSLTGTRRIASSAEEVRILVSFSSFSWGEDQQRRSHYCDDANGYEIYNANEDEDQQLLKKDL